MAEAMGYRDMTDDELHATYLQRFGACFVADWSQGAHRDEVIACLEAGVPQDTEAAIASLPRWPA